MTPDNDSFFEEKFQIALADYAAGKKSLARLTLEEILNLGCESAEVMSLLGIIYVQQGELEKAKKYLWQVLQREPKNPDYLSNYANILNDLGQPEVAAEHYQQAILLRPDFSEAYYGLGNALQKMGKSLEALNSYDQAMALKPQWLEPIINKGNAYESLKRTDEALACYNHALDLQPGHASALLNIGKISLTQANYQAALDSFKAALQFHPECCDAYLDTADLLIRLRRYNEARDYSQQAMRLSPLSSRAYFLTGLAFYKLRDLSQSIKFIEKAIQFESSAKIKATYYQALGNCYTQAFERNKSKEAYLMAAQLDSQLMSVYGHLGDLYFINNELELAYEAFSKFEPDARPDGWMHHMKCMLCDWADYHELTKKFIDRLPCPRLGRLMEDPWHLQRVSDSAALAYTTATNFKISTNKYDDNLLGSMPRRLVRPKIRVGFFSPDLREHPVAHLLLGVFKKLNRDRFELYAFSFGEMGPRDSLRPKLQPLFKQFIDINSMHDEQVARMAREIEIDIAVDLAGITAGNRSDIFGYRLAPVQVNFLGYMGTIGDHSEDYIIADTVTIPQNLKKYYYEKVVTLPSIMPYNDELDATRLVSRAEAGLPEQGFIFACFNPGMKITPMVFESWMRILSAVPNSYLWLSPRQEIAINNLKSEAKKRGIPSERIIFAPLVSDMNFHLARQKQIDLFLDTYPYSAHTTAADALWAGAPLLTRLGESMSSRVAASLLTAVGLSELITTTPEEYEAMAINLAMHPEKIAALKTKLATNRAMSPLFNTRLYTQYFEAALTAMYERSQAGLPPDDIEIKA